MNPQFTHHIGMAWQIGIYYILHGFAMKMLSGQLICF